MKLGQTNLERRKMHLNETYTHDLEFGKKGERLVHKILHDKKIEVKTDREALKTGNVFIEYALYGRPSGLSSSEADYWCFVLSNTQMILIEAKKLKKICRKYLGKRRDIRGGDNKASSGILLPIEDLIFTND